MAEPKYGNFDGIPSRYSEREAWVLDDEDWAEVNSSAHNNFVSELTKEEFDRIFPDIPPLPPTAFRGASSDLTSAGVPWREVPDFARPHAEWLDGRRSPAEDGLPPADQFPTPDVLFDLPILHPDRPRGSKAMGDAHGAQQRLANCRPGAWLISPYTGWRWAKWPNGKVGWLPTDTVLPDCLRVR